MAAGAGWYSRVFVDDAKVTKMIRSGLYIFVISFLFSGVNTITSFYFTSIGNAGESVMISSSRGLAAPMTEGLTHILSLVLATASDRKAASAYTEKSIR